MRADSPAGTPDKGVELSPSDSNFFLDEGEVDVGPCVACVMAAGSH